VPRGPERVVARCQSSTQTRPSWLDERTLVISDYAPRQPPRIRAIDVATGATRDLTSPPPTTLGDYDPVVAPDGRHIVFRRMLVAGADTLYVLDHATSRERPLVLDGKKIAGYAWSNDSRHVFFSSTRGGDFGLWSADLQLDRPPRQVSVGLGAIGFSRMATDRRNRLAVELSRGRTNLSRMTSSGAIEPVTLGTGSDWDPTAATDGTIAHISTRNGSYGVWLVHAGAEPVRVTSLAASYVTTPAWSRDERTIAFAAVVGNRCELYSVARDGSQLNQLTNDGVHKRELAYSASGDRIYYLALVTGSWHLMELRLAPGSQPQLVRGGEDWKVLRTDPAGRIYGQRGTSIVALDPAAPLIDVGLTELDVWAVGTQGIYVRRGQLRQRPSAVWLHPWSGPARKLADTPLATGRISVDTSGAVIFSQSPDQQVDIGRIALRSDS
jgi:Tol biopolymer transport system component